MRSLSRNVVLVFAVGAAALLPAQGHAQTDDPDDAVAAERLLLVQDVTVKWSGGVRDARTRATAVIPGIGQAQIVCRPDDTRIELRPTDRAAETQMWSAKYESKRGRSVVAVKTARVYRHAHDTDQSGSGTGPTAHEGFNQRTPVESRSSGYLHGVISARPGRNMPAAVAATPPNTAFSLSWHWTALRSSKRAACEVVARFVTDVDDRAKLAHTVVRDAQRARSRSTVRRRAVMNRARIRQVRSASTSLNWHGDDDASRLAEKTAQSALGTITVGCASGRDGQAELTVRPRRSSTWVWTEVVTGEGLVEDHVETYDLGIDPISGLLGPIALPRNGLARIQLSEGERKQMFIVSSVRVTNDADHPDQNFCEIAVAPWQS